MCCPKLVELPPPPPGRTGWPWTEETPPLPGTMPDGSPWPQISIVTPSFNQGQFIEETIRSVLLQGYPNLEYIIIDGGSTDGSVEIIKKYEPWLAYWVSEKDDGQSHAINKGWKHSSGEILCWLNSDDTLLMGTLYRAALTLRERPDAGLVYAMGKIVDVDGNPTGQTFGRDSNLISMLLTSRNAIAQPSTFVSRRAIDRVGYLNVEFHMSMDWDLWIRIASRYPIVFVPEIWSRMRVWEGAKTENIWAISGIEHLESVKRLFREQDLPGLNPDDRRHALAAAYGRASLGELRRGHYKFARQYLLRSLFSKPSLMGGQARKSIHHIMLGPRLTRALINMKAKLSRVTVRL